MILFSKIIPKVGTYLIRSCDWVIGLSNRHVERLYMGVPSLLSAFLSITRFVSSVITRNTRVLLALRCSRDEVGQMEGAVGLKGPCLIWDTIIWRRIISL